MSLLVPSRKSKHSLLHRAEAELNLIPLIDILSVMVAFLLVYSTNVEIVQNAKGIAIPQSSSESQPKQSVVVMVTKDQLFVQGELITTVEEIRASTEAVSRSAASSAGAPDARWAIRQRPRSRCRRVKSRCSPTRPCRTRC